MPMLNDADDARDEREPNRYRESARRRTSACRQRRARDERGAEIAARYGASARDIHYCYVPMRVRRDTRCRRARAACRYMLSVRATRRVDKRER